MKISNARYNNVFLTILCIIFVETSPVWSGIKLEGEDNSDTDRQKTNENNVFNNIAGEEWTDFLKLGIDAVTQQQNFERSLIGSETHVHTGTLSHVQLLESWPDEDAIKNNFVAMRILKASEFVYHSLCVPNNISPNDCFLLMVKQPLPQHSNLTSLCWHVLEFNRLGRNPFGRLLPRYYKDGLHELWPENKLPAPRLISSFLAENGEKSSNTPEKSAYEINVAFVQWAQFIEHDLSMPVVTTIDHNHNIECCSSDNYKLAPRRKHPACAPLLAPASHGHQSCLNYVRTALSVSPNCTFGSIEQLNQATPSLDLSPIYGHSIETTRSLRTFEDGQLKATAADQIYESLLAKVPPRETHRFCAKGSKLCFLSGDSRVNSNPLSIVVYTLFVRNHNFIALMAKDKFSTWDDEQLFNAARGLNILCYRNIISNDWLPLLFGKKWESVKGDDKGIYNEFAVAAIRFYLSMMPDALNFTKFASDDVETGDGPIFQLKEQIYTSDLNYTSEKVVQIVKALMTTKAMEIDISYVNSLSPEDLESGVPTHMDTLAFDIQRGRDHGLQPYYKYLEHCTGSSVQGWETLEEYIAKENLDLLKTIYKDWRNIDLIIGGIVEKRQKKAILGPTFSCIMETQFSALLSPDVKYPDGAFIPEDMVGSFNSVNGADFLCESTDLKGVPLNIFKVIRNTEYGLLPCMEKS